MAAIPVGNKNVLSVWPPASTAILFVSATHGLDAVRRCSVLVLSVSASPRLFRAALLLLRSLLALLLPSSGSARVAFSQHVWSTTRSTSSASLDDTISPQCCQNDLA
jgi:hypothetical protein